jgi:hypothetical protein
MDERQLTQLFHDAAEQAGQTAPPPSFDHRDVVAGSRRATERAKRWQTGAAAAAVLAAAATGLASIQVLGVNRQETTLAAPAPAVPPPGMFAERAPAPAPSPGIAPTPGIASDGVPGSAPGSAPGSGPSDRSGQADQPGAPGEFAAPKRVATSSCARPDRGLFEQLAAALPAVRGAMPRPLPDEASCPEGATGFEVDVNDRGAPGVLRVLLSPPGAGGINVSGRGRGSVFTTSAKTEDGGQLSLSMITARPGRIPLVNRLAPVARELADQN